MEECHICEDFLNCEGPLKFRKGLCDCEGSPWKSVIFVKVLCETVEFFFEDQGFP